MSLLRRRPASFSPAETIVPVVVHGAEPVGAFMVGVLDASFGSRLNGAAGHIAPGLARAQGELGQRQAFIGGASLTNNLANATGRLATALPASKAPIDGGQTGMQSTLSRLNGGM